jgi:hypothetical protein
VHSCLLHQKCGKRGKCHFFDLSGHTASFVPILRQGTYLPDIVAKYFFRKNIPRQQSVTIRNESEASQFNTHESGRLVSVAKKQAFVALRNTLPRLLPQPFLVAVHFSRVCFFRPRGAP